MAGRKPLPEEMKASKTLYIRVTPRLYQLITKHAQETGINFSTLVRLCMTFALCKKSEEFKKYVEDVFV